MCATLQAHLESRASPPSQVDAAAPTSGADGQATAGGVRVASLPRPDAVASMSGADGQAMAGGVGHPDSASIPSTSAESALVFCESARGAPGPMGLFARADDTLLNSLAAPPALVASAASAQTGAGADSEDEGASPLGTVAPEVSAPSPAPACI
jgi:hypothetical protein